MRFVIEMFNECDMKQVNNSSTFSMPTLVGLSIRCVTNKCEFNQPCSDFWIVTSSEYIGM